MCERRAVTDYRTVNLANWEERAPVHARSPEYAFQSYVDDPEFLSHVVRFDRPRLGDLTGLRGVHLQCHIGTDTLSLQRLGARMSGLDFSPAALAQARGLAASVGADIEYVLSEVYGALDVLPREGFDLVYTGIGALCWLPDIRRWAEVVSALLRPGGRLFIREGHPMLWAMDDTTDGSLVVGFPYFERPEAIVWEDEATYVTADVTLHNRMTHSWNHGLGEVVTALLEHRMELTMLREHDSVPWMALPGGMVKDEHEEYRMADKPWRLAASYTLQARKR
jgi:SAM-dependent methyltransferase